MSARLRLVAVGLIVASYTGATLDAGLSNGAW